MLSFLKQFKCWSSVIFLFQFYQIDMKMSPNWREHEESDLRLLRIDQLERKSDCPRSAFDTRAINKLLSTISPFLRRCQYFETLSGQYVGVIDNMNATCPHPLLSLETDQSENLFRVLATKLSSTTLREDARRGYQLKTYTLSIHYIYSVAWLSDPHISACGPNSK